MLPTISATVAATSCPSDNQYPKIFQPSRMSTVISESPLPALANASSNRACNAAKSAAAEASAAATAASTSA